MARQRLLERAIDFAASRGGEVTSVELRQHLGLSTKVFPSRVYVWVANDRFTSVARGRYRLTETSRLNIRGTRTEPGNGTDAGALLQALGSQPEITSAELAVIIRKSLRAARGTLHNALSRGLVRRVRRGVYALPKSEIGRA